MASASAGVGEGFAGFGNELPIVTVGTQGQFEDTESVGVAQFAGCDDCSKGPLVLAAGANDKFPNTAWGIANTFGVLWSEAFVVVIVPVHNDIRVSVI